MKFDGHNFDQIRDYLESAVAENILYSEINELARVVTAMFHKAATTDQKALDFKAELLLLIKSTQEKRIQVIDIVSGKIISDAKTNAEKLFIQERQEIEPNLDPRIRRLNQYISTLIDSLAHKYNKLGYWDVTNDSYLIKCVKDALKEVHIPNFNVQVEEGQIIDLLTSILTDQFLVIKKIKYFQTHLDSFNGSIDISFESKERIDYSKDVSPPLDEDPIMEPLLNSSKKPSEEVTERKWISYAKGWHYAIALALLQQSGNLEHTFGRKKITILQAKNYFHVDDNSANNIYDYIKLLKRKDQEQDWNINHALENYLPKKRRNYKLIVKSLLKDTKDAISKVDALID